MNASIFFAQFWGWLTVIFTAIFFARPSVLVDVKPLIVENRSFGISYGLASLILGLASVILHTVVQIPISSTQMRKSLARFAQEADSRLLFCT